VCNILFGKEKKSVDSLLSLAVFHSAIFVVIGSMDVVVLLWTAFIEVPLVVLRSLWVIKL